MYRSVAQLEQLLAQRTHKITYLVKTASMRFKYWQRLLIRLLWVSLAWSAICAVPYCIDRLADEFIRCGLSVMLVPAVLILVLGLLPDTRQAGLRSPEAPMSWPA